GKVSDVIRANGGNSIRETFSKLSRVDAAGMAETSP
ncbi:MAG: ABC transporter ATP-binding protein, partial [Mesorhizobium sp.]